MKIQIHGLLVILQIYVIGVYVGFDDPKSLGKYETGSRTAMPIFKSFAKNVKKSARPFKVPQGKNVEMW